MRRLRIAQIGAVWEKTPPKLYGGTERVIYALTEGLVKRGHKVTLFATGDSRTSATLKWSVKRPLYRDNIPWVNFLYPLYHISSVYDIAHRFDVIHMHLNTRQDYVSLVLARTVETPTLFTVHCVLPRRNEKDKHDRYLFLHKYRSSNFNTISAAQQTLPFLNYRGVVHNGLDFSNAPPRRGNGDYLLWLGRICKEKGTVEAIEAAKRSKKKIILAGKIDLHNDENIRYYESKVKPKIDQRKVKFIGEVDDREKVRLFSRALALLTPLRWNEPFGLTTIEAQANGVPVIAFDAGAIRELVDDGVSGYIVRDVREMARAVDSVSMLDAKLISDNARKRFGAERMTSDYERLYLKIIK